MDTCEEDLGEVLAETKVIIVNPTDELEEHILTAEDVKLLTSGTVIADEFFQDYLNRVCGGSNSEKPTFLANGELDNIVFYSSATQVVANRIMDVQMTYDGSLNPTQEVWQIYDTADGTTILKTITLTHTWVGAEITKTEVSVV